MIKTIIKLKIASPILVLFYLNFFFLSPFIHEHPIEIEGQVEMENVPHSHLVSIANPIANESGYVTNIATSHTHNFAFDIPIIIQPTEKLNTLFLSHTVCLNDKYVKELESKFDMLISVNLHQQVLWDKYVHFATNNSPPRNS